MPALVLALALAAILFAGTAGALDSAPSSSWPERLSLLSLLVLAHFMGLEFRAGGQGNRLDLFDAVLATALISLPGPEVLALVVLTKTVGVIGGRSPLLKTSFNVAQWGCSAAIGSLVFASLREPGSARAGDLVALAVALVVVAAVNNGSVLTVMVAVGGRSVLATSQRGLFRGVATGIVANLLLGLVFAALWVVAPQSRAVIPLVLIAAHVGTRGWAQQRAGGSRLVGLQRASSVLAGPQDLPIALPRFMDEVRQAFACTGVEVHLRVGGVWTRHVSGSDSGAERTAPLVDALLERGEDVRLRPGDAPPPLSRLLDGAGWNDALAATVRVRGEVVGVICTHDREGWEGFESAELGVLEAAAAVLAESVQRSELTDVLREERAALRDSEIRWRALARILELVARRTSLPETMELLAATLEEQTDGARCAVLVRAPGQHLVLAAPSCPADTAAAMEALLLTPGTVYAGSSIDLGELEPSDAVRESARDALMDAGVRTMHMWSLPVSPDTEAVGVLVLCPSPHPLTAHQSQLAADAAGVGGLAVDHVLVQTRLAHQAAHDPLTDLPNRAVFIDRLSRALLGTERGQESVLVLFLDLDRFKVINDSLGHRAGDTLLQSVSERLRAAVRPGDTVARFGGDEFTMLCEGIKDEAHALTLVQRVQNVLERPFPLDGTEVFVTSSIGIALGRGRSQVPETLVDDADAAMYRAKDRGGNCYEMFDAAMRQRAVRRLATQSALHRALERREFRVVYQPTVRLSTGRVEGVEALVRWDRPDHGIVQPVDFVPLAEETGLIVSIGAFVLEEACRQARLWGDEAPASRSPSVSVNLSARQLSDPGIVSLVAGALRRTGVDPATISLEITESVLMDDVASSHSVLTELKALGVRLLVDDFGTGYSSLTYLQRFPMDGLKVDRSFVAGLGSEADAGAIVRAVISLAHGLGLVAIAEGVETTDQVHHLIDLDCDLAQGFHFGRPMRPDQVPLGSGSLL